jgi:hypothetical protein
MRSSRSLESAGRPADRHLAEETLFRAPTGDRVAEGRGAPGPPALGHRTAVPGLKTELGLDHFEGGSYPDWQRHVALTAVAYAFLQRERTKRASDLLQPV